MDAVGRMYPIKGGKAPHGSVYTDASMELPAFHVQQVVLLEFRLRSYHVLGQVWCPCQQFHLRYTSNGPIGYHYLDIWQKCVLWLVFSSAVLKSVMHYTFL